MPPQNRWTPPPRRDRIPPDLLHTAWILAFLAAGFLVFALVQHHRRRRESPPIPPSVPFSDPEIHRIMTNTNMDKEEFWRAVDDDDSWVHDR